MPREKRRGGRTSTLDVTETLHRHGSHAHAHPAGGSHRHLLRPLRSRAVGGSEHHHHARGHSHTHGLVDDSIKRSRAGLRAVALALLVLALTAGVQAVVFAASGSVALLADLIHNTGDAATAIPLGIAFALRSARAERWAGLRSSRRSSSAPASPATRPSTDWSPRRREPGAARGGWGARLRGQLGRGAIRTRAGRRLESAALVADGDHARRRLCLAGRRGKRWGVALGLPLPIRSSHSRSVGSSCESPAAPRRSTDE